MGTDVELGISLNADKATAAAKNLEKAQRDLEAAWKQSGDTFTRSQNIIEKGYAVEVAAAQKTTSQLIALSSDKASKITALESKLAEKIVTLGEKRDRDLVALTVKRAVAEVEATDKIRVAEQRAAEARVSFEEGKSARVRAVRDSEWSKIIEDLKKQQQAKQAEAQKEVQIAEALAAKRNMILDQEFAHKREVELRAQQLQASMRARGQSFAETSQFALAQAENLNQKRAQAFANRAPGESAGGGGLMASLGLTGLAGQFAGLAAGVLSVGAAVGALKQFLSAAVQSTTSIADKNNAAQGQQRDLFNQLLLSGKTPEEARARVKEVARIGSQIGLDPSAAAGIETRMRGIQGAKDSDVKIGGQLIGQHGVDEESATTIVQAGINRFGGGGAGRAASLVMKAAAESPAADAQEIARASSSTVYYDSMEQGLAAIEALRDAQIQPMRLREVSRAAAKALTSDKSPLTKKGKLKGVKGIGNRLETLADQVRQKADANVQKQYRPGMTQGDYNKMYDQQINELTSMGAMSSTYGLGDEEGEGVGALVRMQAKDKRVQRYYRENMKTDSNLFSTVTQQDMANPEIGAAMRAKIADAQNSYKLMYSQTGRQARVGNQWLLNKGAEMRDDGGITSRAILGAESRPGVFGAMTYDAIKIGQKAEGAAGNIGLAAAVPAMIVQAIADFKNAVMPNVDSTKENTQATKELTAAVKSMPGAPASQPDPPQPIRNAAK